MTGCDFLWAVCAVSGVRGVLCGIWCAVFVRRWCAVILLQCTVVAAVRDVLRVRGTCVSSAALECAAFCACLVVVQRRGRHVVMGRRAGWVGRIVCVCACTR